jgi:hypothetical protein
VEVAGERALLARDEPADLGVALKEDHRPAGPGQLGSTDQAVDATPDDDRIGFVRHLGLPFGGTRGQRGRVASDL